MRKLILFIHAGHPIETEIAALERRNFAEYSYELVDFSVSEPLAELALKALLRERGCDLFFFYSLNFWALNIRNGNDLLHTLTGIPLAIMLCDHPVYFLHHLSSSLDGTLIVTPGEDLPDFIHKHYGITADAIGDSGLRPPWKDAEFAPSFDNFLNRKNVLLCPMNLTVFGQNIDDVWTMVKALPLARRARAIRLIEATLTDCATPPHVISERLAAAGDPEIAIEDLRWVITFVKLWRRTRIIEILIDLPILISSNYIPADFERRYPEKFTLLTRPETTPLYGTYRFVVNSNPLIHCFHERVMEALVNNSVCVTDRNAAIVPYFEDNRDLIYFDYGSTDLPERLMRLIDDPQRAFELTVNAHRARTNAAPRTDARRLLLDAVSGIWAK